MPTGFSRLSIPALQRQFRALTDVTITSLLAEPFAATAGELVGTTLAQLGFQTPESMRASLAVLPQHILAALDAERVGLLLPRLHAFQAAVASGLFAAALQQAEAAHERNHAALVAAQAALQTRCQVAEDRLHAVLAHVPLVLFTTDQQGVVTFAVGRGLAALGIRGAQLVGHAIEALAQQPEIVAAVRAALLGEVTTVLVQADSRLFETRYAPLIDDSGTISGVIGVALDVTERTPPLLPALLLDLTPEDRTLLSLLAQGRSNRQMGAALGIGPKAVEKRLASLFARLNVRNRVEAAVWAVRAGLI